MPRRPPKKPPASLDLTVHLVPIAAIEPAGDPRAAFRSPAPVELEIGSGKGLFLAAASAARPDTNFLGVEISAGYARLCAGRLAAAHAANARIVHGDGTFLVRSLLPDASLAAIHVYFPDPWWKARHRKRRVLSDTFLEHAARILAASGSLHVWTDVEEYFRETLTLAAATGLFAAPFEEPPRPATHDLDYRTHFERRTRLAGQPVWRARLDRNDAASRCRRIDVPPA